MKRLILTVLVLLLLVAGISYLNHQGTSQEKVFISGTTMGTSYNLTLVPSDGQKIDPTVIKEKIDARLADINFKLSTFKNDSEVSRFNQHYSMDWMPVSAETAAVIKASQEISWLTNGAFDITIAPLVNLWGFGSTINFQLLPDVETVEELLSDVGYQHLELQQNPPALRKTNKAITINLAAIAKGYAVDVIANLLTDKQINNFMLEIGGEIITRGSKRNQQPWIIGIENPVSGQRSVRKKLFLKDVAMATSGDYRNYFEYQGERYSHTINPTTGYPVKHQLASVTVITSSCMRADALATAIMVMGPKAGLAFAEQQRLAIYMLVAQNGHIKEIYSTAFTPYLKPEKD